MLLARVESPLRERDVGVDHHPDELGKAHLRRPAELFPGAPRIGDQEVDLRGAAGVARVAEMRTICGTVTVTKTVSIR